jgi:FdhD protein
MDKMSKRKVKVTKEDISGRCEKLDDFVALDAPICLFVNDEHFRTLMASPNMLKELAIGHLLSEGVISSLSDIKALSVKDYRVEAVLNHEVDVNNLLLGKSILLTTACGMDSRIGNVELNRIKVNANERLNPKDVVAIIGELNRRGTIFRETGGTHSALIYHIDAGELAFSEDVGRHNAIDKVIGAGFLKNIKLNECVLASSGRISGEIVLKAARAGITHICSVSAPLYSGVKLACSTGVELVGFVRGPRMNRYAC